MTDTSARLVTCAHCAGVVDLVCEGDISVKDGVERLVVFRQVGTSARGCSLLNIAMLWRRRGGSMKKS